ncbi:MAG: tripartite tricarboxylate transporter permease [Treponemataceae bacterium]
MVNSLLTVILNPLMYCFIGGGVFLGIIIGALPGLTATMGVALILPLTFGISLELGLALLLGVYVGAIYGGSISAIILNIPGTPASAATLYDGYPLTQQGLGGKALSISTIASVIGGIVGTLILILASPLLAKFALTFSPTEYFALMIFGLSIIISVSEKNMIKGLISGLIGLLIATVGLDPINSVPRFTFGNVNLLNGFSIIPVLIGLFALSSAFNSFVPTTHSAKAKKIERYTLSLKDILITLPTMIKSGILGTFVGSIPGAGADIAAFLCYNEAKRSDKENTFGTGNIKGVAAAEAGNNAVTAGALVPLLSLGVPGDAVAAVMLGALTIHGVNPGPLLFQNNLPLVYSIFIIIFFANLFLLGLGLIGTRFFPLISKVPSYIITPLIIVLSLVGSYSINNNFFDIWVALFFGLLGFVMTLYNIPLSPIVLAIILGPMAETNLRRSLLLYNNSWHWMYTRPITLIFLLVSLFAIGHALLRSYKFKKSGD